MNPVHQPMTLSTAGTKLPTSLSVLLGMILLESVGVLSDCPLLAGVFDVAPKLPPGGVPPFKAFWKLAKLPALELESRGAEG